MQTLKLTSEDLAAIRRELYQQDFYEFRVKMWKMMGNTKPFKHGWWQKEVARELMRFYDDYLMGKRPKLIIKTPPQHGKSDQITDFIIWISGKHPSLKSIFASFSKRLGVRTNLRIQRAMLHPEWEKIFPNTKMGALEKDSGNKQVFRAKRNNEMIEFQHYGGSFRNTTTLGQITGESLDLGFIDDPLKGREAANSETIREKTWEWFIDDFFTRFADDSGFICIGTNWHIDDPIQRMIDAFGDKIRVVSYPAIAIEDEKHRKKGEALFPEHKSLEFLLERKGVMKTENWESLYQQNPILPGGNKFKDEMIYFGALPSQFDFTFVTADTAYKGTQQNDFTCFSVWGVYEGNLYLIAIWKHQIDAEKVEVPVLEFLKSHLKYGFRNTWIEPKGHGIYLNQKFTTKGVGIPTADQLKEFFADRRLDKIERANNVLPHLGARRLIINELIPDKEDLKSELLQFPQVKHDDFTDTTIDALKVAFGRAPSILDVL